MTDAEQRLYYTPTEEQARKSLQTLINGEHSLHVPPLPEDEDIVISNVILEWTHQRQIMQSCRDAILTNNEPRSLKYVYETLTKELEK